MEKISPRLRIFIIFACILFLIPLVIFVITKPKTAPQLLSDSPKSIVPNPSHYSVQTDISGYKLKLNDVRYLDYLVQSLHLFDTNAITDPQVYQNKPEIKTRYTVANIKFILAKDIENPFYMEINDTGAPRPIPWGKADYIIEDKTLVIRVFLDIKQLTSGSIVPQFTLEDKYLQMVGQAFVHAKGYKDQQSYAEGVYEIKSSIKTNLNSRLLSWPFLIESI